MRKINLPWLLLAALSLFAGSCRDIPRDNPFDPQSTVLLVSVDSPADSSVFCRGDTISFRVSALRGFDNQPAGKEFLWNSDIAGFLSSMPEFSTDSLSAGTHWITVRVTDESGRQGAAMIRITVLPTPEFGVRIRIPVTDTILLVESSFQPEAIEYVPAGSKIIGRLWTFGEGSGISNSTMTYPGTVLWNQAGSFLLVYQIVDELGRTAADSVRVTVLAESVPPFVAIVSPPGDTTLTAGDSVFFEALEIKTTARIMHRNWIYPSGSGLESQIDKVLVPGWRTFANPGTFPVIFRVTDALGVVSADTVTVTVSELPPPPISMILAVSNDTTITRGDSIHFEGGHTPSAAVVTRWRWVYDQASGITPAQDTVDTPGWRKFSLIGEFRIFYTVSDRWGRSSTDTLTVRVVESRPLIVEITQPSADTTIAAWTQPIIFVGTDSDQDGTVVSRSWSFGWGSGVSSAGEDKSTSSPKTFTLPGNFMVVYAVTNNRGLTARDSVRMTVLPNSRPSAQILSPLGDATISAGDSLLFIGIDSDPGGLVVSRSWNYGTGSGIDAASDTVNVPGHRTFHLPGTFTVTFKVIDNQGATNGDSLTVIVNP